LLKNGGLAALSNTKQLGRYAVMVIGVAAAGYLLAVFFWPYALQSPLKNPFVALSKFSELEVKIRVLYEGENIMSDKTPLALSGQMDAVHDSVGYAGWFGGVCGHVAPIIKKIQPALDTDGLVCRRVSGGLYHC
jgi:hypothetical protein